MRSAIFCLASKKSEDTKRIISWCRTQDCISSVVIWEDCGALCKEKYRSVRRKLALSTGSTGLQSKPGLHGEIPRTKCLNHSTALPFCCLISIALCVTDGQTSVALFRGDAPYRGAECCVCVTKKQVTFKCGVITLEELMWRLLRIKLDVNKSFHIWTSVWMKSTPECRPDVILLNIANWNNSSRTEQTEFSQWNYTKYLSHLNILSQFTVLLNVQAATFWRYEYSKGLFL
jgi:hypothetical protein